MLIGLIVKVILVLFSAVLQLLIYSIGDVKYEQKTGKKDNYYRYFFNLIKISKPSCNYIMYITTIKATNLQIDHLLDSINTKKKKNLDDLNDTTTI